MAEPQAIEAPVLLDRPAEGVARLTLNGPLARNAPNFAPRQALADAFDALERRAVALLFDTGGQKEGMRAFAEHRAPAFTGR
ncbi:hypothetical protein [Pseudorhodoferax soli]|uniref:Enoyl-CoA hydratase/isomerase-like protein n=1 Tax=Pseudorhodoferax soli TaxID=545864 RepID=A0A368XHJ6_9BURK|nr:hypothetical protein [Pseudorhodoferax soli]RCW67470.1 hypothetical protein DES41_109193 [Pseudorhodoferax soli]